MGSSVRIRFSVLALASICLSLFCLNMVRGYEDATETPYEGRSETPYEGIYETPPHEGTYETPPHEGASETPHEGASETPHEGGSETPYEGASGKGVGGDDPAQIVSKALLCFNDKYIYKSCDESYRLTISGNLNVPPDYADEYCTGPCLEETQLVLGCIDNILSHFVFYNKATVEDIRDTIKAGCGYGPERGHFDVAEHLQSEEDGAHKAVSWILLGPAFMFLVHQLLL